jgi:hypothetical protein
VSEPLRPLQNKLDNVQHALESLQDKEDLHPRDLLPLRRKLAEIDAHYHEGRFESAGRGGEHLISEGQAVLAALLNNAHETLRALLLKTDYYKVRWKEVGALFQYLAAICFIE